MKQKYLLLTIILFVFLFLFSTPSLALIPGDFGSAGGGPPDGVVDFEDLMIFALAYGSTSADANWNEVCDIYLDGIIDFEDLMIFALHYGESNVVQTTPTFDPPAGPIAFGTTVTITSAGADAIYYTTNGSDPTTASTNQATTPLVINAAVTVKAIAVKAGSDNSAIASATYTQAAAAVIDIEAIPGVTVPETGATPVTTITETAQYTGNVTWSPADDPFLGSKVYTATITLTVKAGFTLTGVAENFFTVAGAVATNPINSGVVTAVFPETAIVIDIEAIPGVTVPVVGATPVTAITATAQYTGTVTWAPTDNPFVVGAYTAWITLTAKTGFTLTGVVANFFTVAGTSSPATNAADSGVVTAVFPETELKVGDSYGGGIVAYIFQSGDPGYDANVQHGLIAATADQSTGIAWSNITSTSVGTTGIALGTGQANTTAIVGQAGCTSGAAKLCDDLTEGGYNDWFLPSRDELNKLYINKGAIGGFADYYYWSSSEYYAANAWDQFFLNGGQGYGNKDDLVRVRAVRAF